MNKVSEEPHYITSRVQELAHLRYHATSCWNCRYIRRYQCCSECILLGRTMAVSEDSSFHMCANRERTCDFWAERPKTWRIYTDKNPHWEDAYYKRSTLLRKRRRIYKADPPKTWRAFPEARRAEP
jgi:hypothetical protein